MSEKLMENGELKIENGVSEWRKAVLGDLLTFGNGKRKPSTDGDIPIYGGNGILGFTNDSNYQNETIIIGRVGAYCGSVYYERQPIWISDNALSAKPKNDYSLKFLYYFLKQLDLNQYAGGSSHPLVTQTLLNSLEFDVCTNPYTQKSIAEVLSSLDDKIDLLHRQNKTLEQMAETLFRQWFVEEAREDWEEGIISDLVDFNPKRVLAKGTIATYLEMASLNTQTFNPDSWYDREFKSGTKFINEDTLLARITPCLENGKTAYVTFLEEKQVAWGSTEYIVMRPKEEIHPFFAYTLARNKDFREYAEGCLAGSSGRQRIDLAHLKNFDMPIPPKSIIENFNKSLETVVPKLIMNAAQIRTLQSLRDTLLPKLMSGEVRVSYNEEAR